MKEIPLPLSLSSLNNTSSLSRSASVSLTRAKGMPPIDHPIHLPWQQTREPVQPSLIGNEFGRPTSNLMTIIIGCPAGQLHRTLNHCLFVGKNCLTLENKRLCFVPGTPDRLQMPFPQLNLFTSGLHDDGWNRKSGNTTTPSGHPEMAHKRITKCSNCYYTAFFSYDIILNNFRLRPRPAGHTFHKLTCLCGSDMLQTRKRMFVFSANCQFE